MIPDVVFPAVNFRALGPILAVSVAALLVLLLDLLPPRERKEHLGAIGLAGALAALFLTVSLWGGDERAFGGMVILDRYAQFFYVVIGYALGLVLLLSLDYVRRQGIESGEFYLLALFSAVGMMLMASAGDLIMIFLGLEIMSIALYVLTGFFRDRLEAGEASLKYFLLGAFASGFLLYGIALVYGATGATNLDRIGAAVAGGASRDPLLVIGFGLLLVGFGFKIAVVPFHMWAADVYQGAPTSITAFIATGSKAAAFAALVRVLLSALPGAPIDWAPLVWVLAALSMTLGNVVAIAQQDLKRMLAYSSIAHGGYMLIGVVAGGSLGYGAVLFYMLVYTFTTVGAFGVLLLLERDGAESVDVRQLAGLAARHPLLAVVLSVFLLSLIGIPPTAGFVGKFYLFGGAVQAGYVWLAVVGVLNSAVAAYYYLRVIVYMYMREPDARPATLTPSFSGGLALAVAVWGVIHLGILPASFLDGARAALAPLLR